ncbi:sporulation integral membrane protein YtvI [bacterium C-53]|nr:sporulation integral membrane protein YtvI [Lachnospiraceae bacterium]NBI02357.1 sporulation integral membrane protein YtvI [Lachnospiraceae bacterium]RKJ11910.1 sporulation integral membrane protein YtvI [bacterium C-53]
MKSSTKYLKVALNLLIALLFLLFCAFLLPKLIKFFMPFILGWVIAMIANPLVKFLDRKFKVVRKAASAVIIILVIGAVILILYNVAMILGEQVRGFMGDLPETWKSMQADLDMVGRNLSRYYDKLPEDMQERMMGILESSEEILAGLGTRVSAPTVKAAGNFAKNIPLAMIYIIMTLISAYFFIADRETILEFVRTHTSQGMKERFQVVSDSLRQAVGGYFKAQFKIMGIVAVILFIGLKILRVRYVTLIAFLIAFLDFLPFFGTGTVMLPWAVIKFLSGNYKMTIGLLIIWAVSQLVRQIIQPKIVGDSMGMPAIPTMFLLYIGFRLGGAVGLIIAVPVGMIVYNLYKAGLFSNTIRSMQILITDINEFRKIDEGNDKNENEGSCL